MITKYDCQSIDCQIIHVKEIFFLKSCRNKVIVYRKFAFQMLVPHKQRNIILRFLIKKSIPFHITIIHREVFKNVMHSLRFGINKRIHNTQISIICIKTRKTRKLLCLNKFVQLQSEQYIL